MDCADAMTCAGEDLFAAASRRKRGAWAACSVARNRIMGTSGLCC